MSVKVITSENFETEVLKSAKPVMLDFWASWCGPCRMLSPIIDEISEERSDITVGKVNVDDENSLAMTFGIASIPTVLLFKDGKEINRIVGVHPKKDILAML